MNEIKRPNDIPIFTTFLQFLITSFIVTDLKSAIAAHASLIENRGIANIELLITNNEIDNSGIVEVEETANQSPTIAISIITLKNTRNKKLSQPSQKFFFK